ncbi:hypothetical protein [Nocardia rhizosphaerae]|uniref:Uncharacterized protein n=1 Tax=Nocardia rhizosphaerae TaxID=1691571 RepID=A0ABV8L7G4_9NOCA
MTKSNRARNRAVRQYMAENNTNYTRAARETGSAESRTSHNSTDLVRSHLRALLSDLDDDAKGRDARIEELEKQGHRIVSGGQISQHEWDITDWRTGEIIASGSDGLEGYDAAVERLDDYDTWFHIDHVCPEVPPLPVTAGIPKSLGEALADWIGSTLTSDQDIAELVGWSEERVRRCRRE